MAGKTVALLGSLLGIFLGVKNIILVGANDIIFTTLYAFVIIGGVISLIGVIYLENLGVQGLKLILAGAIIGGINIITLIGYSSLKKGGQYGYNEKTKKIKKGNYQKEVVDAPFSEDDKLFEF